MSDRVAARMIVAVIAAAAAVYLLGNGSVALWDRDEPRYAQTSRQMLESGDWVVPHYLDAVRTAKPPMIYWCEAAAMKVFGVNSFAARFPSSASILLLLIGLAIVLGKYADRQRAAWTVFVLATAGLTIASAKMCITDGLLLLCVTATQLCLYAAWRGNGTWPVVIVWAVASGLGGLTKGPVGIGMQAMTFLALGGLRLWDWYFWRPPPAVVVDHPEPIDGGIEHESVPPHPPSRPALIWFRPISATAWIKALVWIVIVTAIVLPWVVLVNHRAKEFGTNVLHHELVDRMLTPLEQHKGPPGYYFLTLWGTFFPWSLLLPLAVGSAWVRRADARLRFAIAAVVGPWVMLECVQTKLPFYFLPALPALAFMVGDAIVRTIKGELNDVRRTLFVAVVGGWSVLVIALSLGPWFAVIHGFYSPIAIMIGLNLLAVAFAAAVWISFRRRRVVSGFLAMGFGTLLIIAGFYAVYLPGAQFLRVSPRVADVLAEHHVTGDHQLLMIGYAEPSLGFYYKGGMLREGGKIGFVRGSIPDFTPWLVVPRTMFDAAPKDLQERFDVVDHVYGLAYADRGKWVDVLVLHRRKEMTNDQDPKPNQ